MRDGKQSREIRPTWARTETPRQPGSSSTSFASIGWIGGAIANAAGCEVGLFWIDVERGLRVAMIMGLYSCLSAKAHLGELAFIARIGSPATIAGEIIIIDLAGSY